MKNITFFYQNCTSRFPTSYIFFWPFFFIQEQNEIQIKPIVESNLLLLPPSSLSYGAEY